MAALLERDMNLELHKIRKASGGSLLFLQEMHNPTVSSLTELGRVEQEL